MKTLAILALTIAPLAYAAPMDLDKANSLCGKLGQLGKSSFELRKMGINRHTMDVNNEQQAVKPEVKFVINLVLDQVYAMDINTRPSVVETQVYATCMNNAAKD